MDRLRALRLGWDETKWGLRTLQVFVLVFPSFVTPLWGGGSESKLFFLLVFTCAAFLGLLPVVVRNWVWARSELRDRVPVLVAALLGAYSLLVLGVQWRTLGFAFAALAVACLWNVRRVFLATTSPKLHWVFWGFVGWSTLVCVLSGDQLTSLVGADYRGTGLLAVFCLSVLYCSCLRTVREGSTALRLLRCLLLGGVLPCVVGLGEFLKWEPLMFLAHKYSDGRAYSTMGQPNWFGAYLTLLLPTAAFLYLHTGRKWLLALVALFFATSLATLSRGAWVASAVLFSFWFAKYLRLPRYWQLIAVLGLVFLVIAPARQGLVWRRMLSLNRERELAIEGSIHTGSQRFALWQWVLHSNPRHWVFGVGLDCLAEARDDRDNPVMSKAHNIALELAVTLGLPGLFLYLALVWLCFNGFTEGETASFFWGLLVAYLVQGMFIHDSLHSWPTLWILMGLAAALRFGNQRIELCSPCA